MMHIIPGDLPYKNLGFVERAPIGVYVADPYSVFMTLHLR
jgi:hypothetical protein